MSNELYRSFILCFLQLNPTLLAAGLSREVIELDISSITSPHEPNEMSDDENEVAPGLLPQTLALVFSKT